MPAQVLPKDWQKNTPLSRAAKPSGTTQRGEMFFHPFAHHGFSRMRPSSLRLFPAFPYMPGHAVARAEHHLHGLRRAIPDNLGKAKRIFGMIRRFRFRDHLHHGDAEQVAVFGQLVYMQTPCLLYTSRCV